MQIFNHPFEEKGNKNNVRNSQMLMRGLKTLSKSASSQNTKSVVTTFVKGQVIKGLVLDVSNKQVTLQLENGEKISATLKDAAPLNIGEELYFEVKDESQNQVQLRPLTDPNVNPQNATLEKVLNSHGLMMNEKNLSIVSELMEQGMNLDDATIRTIIRNSAKFPDSSIKTLVLMEKLQLPVNETSLSKLSEYEEGNGMILKQTEDFINRFCEEVQVLKEKEGFQLVAEKLSQMMESEKTEMSKEALKPEIVDDFKVNEIKQIQLIPGQKASEQKLIEEKESLFFKEFDADKLLSNNSSETIKFILSDASSFKEVLSSLLELSKNPLIKGSLTLEAMQEIVDAYVKNLSKEETMLKVEQILIKFRDTVKEDETDSIRTTDDAISSQQMKQDAKSIVEFFHHIDFLNRNQNLNQAQNQTMNLDTKNLIMKLESELASLREFLESREFNGIIKGALQEKWYAEPEDLKDDFKVKEQLRKIGTDLNRISELFEKEGGFTKTAELSNQIKDNIDFMNQVNQYYQYVQIPLKLTRQLTNSELYVYTNKKNLKNQDGQISVLLHLDMKHLGSTDIHVSLVNQSLHTRFYLEEEDSLEILKQHVNELEAAMQKLGYTMSYEMNVRQQMSGFADNLLEEKPKSDIKRYNFDVRM